MASLLVFATLVCLGVAEKKKRPGPAAHYVIRTSDLKTTLTFTEQVLGLKVLRHEENAEACPITCNGDYAVPWSKTMVGTLAEDEAYALEVTYNYGVEGYEKGVGLRAFEMYVEDFSAALQAAEALGYSNTGIPVVGSDAPLGPNGEVPVFGHSIVGPDGYTYNLFMTPPGRREPFAAVTFLVPDPSATAKWYVDTLGMREMGATAHSGGKVVAFPSDASESVVFKFDEGAAFDVKQFDGRNAFSLPAAKVRAVYDHLAEHEPDRIVHELQEINEETGLGVLLIAIVSDINGLELCLVSSEAFEPAIAGAANYVGPDYDARVKLALDHAGKVADAKKNKPAAYGWAAEL